MYKSFILHSAQFIGGAESPGEVVTFNGGRALSGDSNKLSVIIGPNGSGKSRLMRSIAHTFQSMQVGKEGRLGRRASGHPSCAVEYEVDGERFFFDPSVRPLSSKSDGNAVLLGHPTPSKVIVYSASVFDKFPRPAAPVADPSTRYAYLGMRDRTGRASPKGAIVKVLEGLAGISGEGTEKRTAVARVFDFLGYFPSISISCWLPENLEKMQHDAFSYLQLKIDETIENGRVGPNLYRQLKSREEKISRYINAEPDGYETFTNAIDLVLQQSRNKRKLDITMNLAMMQDFSPLFRAINLLRRLDLIRLHEIFLTRKGTDGLIEISEASSGELSVVLGILGIAAHIDDGSLILVDEPEISLHPAWQEQYVDLLLGAFQEFSGCHFILATHSPIILHDIPEGNGSVAFMGNKASALSTKFSAMPLDHLLIEAFDVVSDQNLYIKNRVAKALKVMIDGDFQNPLLTDIREEFVRILPLVSDDERTQQLLSEIVQTIEIGRGRS